MWRRCLIVGTVVFAVSGHVAAQTVHRDGKPFAVVGERVDAPLPEGAKLAYMAGNPKGEFIAEFASPQEDITRWKTLFIAQQRVNDTLPNTFRRTLQGIQSACGKGKLAPPQIFAPRKDIKPLFEGKILALALHCRQAMPNAPFGELTAMLFFQGQKHNFKYWRSWRPQNQQQLTTSLQESQSFFADGLKSVDLCQPQAGRACRHSMLPQ